MNTINYYFIHSFNHPKIYKPSSNWQLNSRSALHQFLQQHGTIGKKISNQYKVTGNGFQRVSFGNEAIFSGWGWKLCKHRKNLVPGIDHLFSGKFISSLILVNARKTIYSWVRSFQCFARAFLDTLPGISLRFWIISVIKEAVTSFPRTVVIAILFVSSTTVTLDTISSGNSQSWNNTN